MTRTTDQEARAPRRWLLAVLASIASLLLAEAALHVLDLPSRSAQFEFVIGVGPELPWRFRC